jgi:sigma-B regulation protein RsbU (phosphoserine phosphatase)
VGAGAVSKLDGNGLPLGLFPDAEYTSHRITLGPGDCLVAHSDGLSETFNAAGEQYGSERLYELLGRQGTLTPGQRLAAVLEDLDRFRLSAPIRDDLTVMVIGRDGPA